MYPKPLVLFHDMKGPIIWMKPLKHGRNCQLCELCLCQLSTKPSCCCSCAIFCCSCTACLPGTGKRMILLGQTPSIRCVKNVKTLYPCSSHQNSWDLWMFIPLKMVLIGIDPYPCGDVATGDHGNGIKVTLGLYGMLAVVTT